MALLDGWKAIATYLRRDERTAMRWAADRAMPVHRVPGPGRGSVYAVAEEIDAWRERDRERGKGAVPAIPAAIDPVVPPAVTLSPVPWWRRRRTANLMIAAGMLLMAAGAVTLHGFRPASPPEPVFGEPATKAMFLQASYDWSLRTPDSLSRAVHEYSETIGRDPRVPAAYVGLANSYLLLREYGSLPDPVAYARAAAAARAAVALSPVSAEAHRALAFIAFWWSRDRDTARREFRRALALRPDDPLTHHWLANALLANGEAAAALREIDRAREIDPAATSIVADRGMILYAAGQRAEGLASLRDLAREQPGLASPHRALAEIAMFEGRMDEFLRESLATARLRGDTAGLANIGRWRAAGPGANRIEEAMLRDALQTGGNWFQTARLMALAGRRNEARDALARACDAHEPAAVSAPGDLWLSRMLGPADIAARCESGPLG